MFTRKLTKDQREQVVHTLETMHYKDIDFDKFNKLGKAKHRELKLSMVKGYKYIDDKNKEKVFFARKETYLVEAAKILLARQTLENEWACRFRERKTELGEYPFIFCTEDIADFFDVDERHGKFLLEKLRQFQVLKKSSLELDYAKQHGFKKPNHYIVNREKLYNFISLDESEYNDEILKSDIEELKQRISLYMMRNTILDQYKKSMYRAEKVVENIKAHNKELSKEEEEAIFEKEYKKSIAKRISKEKEKSKKLAKHSIKSIDFIMLLNELNEKYYTDKDMQLKYLAEGSLRLFHNICNTPNEKNDNYTRPKVLNALFDLTKAEFEAFDVNGSIYNLTKALGHQMPVIKKDTDIYKEIFDLTNLKLPKGITFNQIRKYIKINFMPIAMMSNGASWTAGTFDIVKNNTNSYSSDFKYDKTMEVVHKDLFERFDYLCNLFKITAKQLVLELKTAMLKSFGINKFFNYEIFIHESNVHLLLLKKLCERGLKVINVYDCFYLEKGKYSNEQFIKDYNECVEEYIKFFSKPDTKDNKSYYTYYKKRGVFEKGGQVDA